MSTINLQNFSLIESTQDVLVLIDDLDGVSITPEYSWSFSGDGERIVLHPDRRDRPAVALNLKGSRVGADAALRRTLQATPLLVQVGTRTLDAIELQPAPAAVAAQF
jgi:hypothetical protein